MTYIVSIITDLSLPTFNKKLAYNHDIFNIITLLPINILNYLNWNGLKIDYPNNDWKGDYFWSLLVYFMIYILTDTYIIIKFPNCVKCPKIILGHHISTIISLTLPIFYENTRWAMGGLLLVEFNTWHLTLRRVKLPYLLYLLNELLFYITWFTFRIYYNLILMKSIFKYWLKTDTCCLGILCLIPNILLILNLKWSYSLIKNLIYKNDKTSLS